MSSIEEPADVFAASTPAIQGEPETPGADEPRASGEAAEGEAYEATPVAEEAANAGETAEEAANAGETAGEVASEPPTAPVTVGSPSAPAATAPPTVPDSPAARRIAAEVASLATLAELPLAEHADAYQRVHVELQRALAEIDGA